MKRVFHRTHTIVSSLTAITLLAGSAAAQTNRPAASAGTNAIPQWLTRALTLQDAVNLALKQNGTILTGQKDLEATYGVVVQTRAIALPKARLAGEYASTDLKDRLETQTGAIEFSTDHRWNVGFRLVQSLYEGGRIRASLRSAKLTKEQAVMAFQRVVSDTLTDVRVAYYEVLQAAQQIEVQEASVNLLTRQLEDTQRRFEAETVPRFNVLRAEVELANAKPRLIRARNTHRIAKNNLANLLGYNIPKDIWEDIPLQLTDKLTATAFDISLPAALGKAMELRPELGVLRKAEGIRREAIKTARAGYLPSLQAFGGYGARKSQFNNALDAEIHGWEAGVEMSWDLFDGNLTRGRVAEAKALHERSETELDDTSRRIELEVRTAYSQFLEAKEVIESQKKVLEQAEEAVRLAESRYSAGAGTQLEVLSAQTSLTDARSTNVQALRDYVVALARLERAIGLGIPQSTGAPKK